MIVSHQHRFIFVKTLKTAGTSIEVFLSRSCGPQDVVTPIIPHVEPHVARNHEGFYNHMPAADIRDKVGTAVWNSYFKFCVERNPWDKTISYFQMKKKRSKLRETFDQFVEGDDLPINFPKYTERDDPSKVIVDEVLHYEDLTAGLTKVFRQLGIDFDGSLGVYAKSEYRTDRRQYREVYTPRQAQRIAQAFSPELHLHGYAF